ncbi:hypothetical protein [Erythrobacter sp. MTPC3]|uniref:hypothetical protein n=1 Tax=Sphingomonadales TaxID=204457 RepID=UPI0036F298C5
MSRLGRTLLIVVVALLTPSIVSAQNFTVVSVPDPYTAIYTDGSGRTITVRGEPQNTSCFAFDATGVADVFARSSIAACDRAIEIRFETSGFLFDSVVYPDIDDIDGTAPRDSFAANVPGTWTSPTIEVHSFASPPAYADQASRLSSAGAVGTFLANDAGDNPTNETATFSLTTPSSSFSIFYDDVQGGRNARAFFNLNFIIVQTAQGAVVAVSDSASGIDGVSGALDVVNAYDGDTLNGVAAGPTNTTLAVAAGSSVPAGLNFDTSTGQVSVNAGTSGGTYSFDYEICEIGFPTNCQIATVTVDVTRQTDLSITKTNTPGVNGEVDQASDTVVSGSTTTYTLVVTNNGPDTSVGAIVTDTPGTGLSCPAANAVTITGSGVPPGSFTVSDLTGVGITLGSLANGESTTLSFSCTVN